jgi:hypothetical protein
MDVLSPQSYLVQTGIGSGTGLKPALDFKLIDAHQEITIAGIVSLLRASHNFQADSENIVLACVRIFFLLKCSTVQLVSLSR